MKAKWVTIAALFAVGLALLSAPVALAAETTPPQQAERAMGVRGQVSAIEGSVISVQTLRGLQRVMVDEDTRFVIPGVDEPGLDDVAVGNLIGAAGAWNDDGSLQATTVVVPREMDRQTRLVGEVAAVEDDRLTLSVRGDRQFVLAVNDETTFIVPGVENPSLDDVQVGDRVAVRTRAEEGTPVAQTVAVLPEEAATVAGQVSAITGATLTVETRGGPVEVLTGADTHFRVPDVENPTIADIHVGDGVICGGEWDGETTFRALAVAVPRGSQGAGRTATLAGRVTAVGSDQLTVGTMRGPTTVRADGETTFRVPGVENPTLADIQVGNRVLVRGTWNEDGTVQAQGVMVREGFGRLMPGRRQPDQPSSDSPPKLP